MANKSNVKSENEGAMSLSDLIVMQENLKKDIDFDKPDEELTPTEHVMKGLYSTLDNAVEKSVGKDVKKDIDEKRKEMELLTTFQANFKKLTELGREIERNFVFQSVYLSNHFQKDDNNYYFVTTRKLTEYALAKDTSINERLDAAHKVLEVVKIYDEKVISELNAKQAIITALLVAFEKNLKSTDFSVLGNDLETKTQLEEMASKYEEWLNLSKELSENRKNAAEGVREDLDIDQIIPNQLIKNDGDTTGGFSAVELKSKGDRMVRLVNEANDAEKVIDVKRSGISEDLFGKAEEYMDFGEKSEVSGIKWRNPLEGKAWFRFLKVVYIGLWVVGLGFVGLLSYASNDIGTFVIGAIIVWILLSIMKKAFFYVALGNK